MNAAVLPLPVIAQARTSCPASAGGTASAWIGVGRTNPSSLIPLRRFGWSLRELNGTRDSLLGRSRSIHKRAASEVHDGAGHRAGASRRHEGGKVGHLCEG